jgi:hypothetical protein
MSPFLPFCRCLRAAAHFLSVLAAFLILGPVASHAAPVSQREALATAGAWLGLSPEAMREQHGALAGTVTPVRDTTGTVQYYVVDLKPGGFVIVAADDTVEPVIAFSSTDTFKAEPGHPLYDMLRADLPARLARVHAGRAGRAEQMAPGKWRMLRAASARPKLTSQIVYTAGSGSIPSVSDVRVAPLVHSKWDQLTSAYGQPVFNYYTPPYGAGNVNNYWTGCVATMLGQIMRFHQWPQSSVGTASYQITVRNNNEQRSLRGGDGAGGSYSWGDMPLVATSGMPAIQEQEIGALLADAGVASHMDYEPSGSGASINASVLTNVFHYANAAFANGSIGNLEVAIDANLDAGLPVGLGISGNGAGHAVVADGYGYNASTLYHHLNMGWSGADNAWYNLPTIVAGGYDFNVVNGVLFNVDPKVKGEIISGRVTDEAGKPIAGAQVTLTSGSVVITATTSSAGVYAAKGLGSNTNWKVAPVAAGYAFTPAVISVSTGHSGANGGIGDKNGIDFSSRLITGSVSVQINAGAAASGAEWRVNNGPWQVSGATVTGIPTGTRTIAFRAAKDWVTPGDQQIDVQQDQTADATVTYSPLYSLVATSDNPSHGGVSQSPAPGELGSYPPGTSVMLSATASSGYYFAGWLENGEVVSTDATYATVVKSARQLVADFSPAVLTGSNTQGYVTNDSSTVAIDVLSTVTDLSGSASVLSVTQPANGTVTINGDGTLTFTPGRGFRGSTEFSYSVGNGNGSLTRVVTISNWFAASAGSYAGLSLASEVTNDTSGFLKVTVGASGAFTGRLAVAGLSYTLHGAFDANANYQKVIARKDGSTLTVSLHLNPAANITGTVSDGTTTSDLTAGRLIYGATHKAPQAGRYTALLSSNTAVPGNGYLMVSISTGGGVAATGRMADGTPVSLGSLINPDGTVQYYAGLYATRAGAGSLLGNMLFESGSSPTCSGTYAWFRPASTGVYYPAGFAVAGTATGAYIPPAVRGERPQRSIAATLSSGDLSSGISEFGTLLANGRAVWSAPGPEKLTLSIASSGQITGGFVDPATGKKRVILGVWLPAQSVGGGFFVAPDSAGALTLSP